MQKVIVILGPTGVGKSEMGISLAKNFDGEIISADSVQIFKGFDIGSAKITKEEMENIPHHCIDILEPNEEFSVYDYVEMTKQKIEEISKRNHLPIIVGGTGLYIKALINGYDFGGVSKNKEFREHIIQELEKNGFDFMYEKLKQLSLEVAKDVNKNNVQRLVRAFEIATFGHEKKRNESSYDFKVFALTFDREKLYDKINKRVEIMLDKGLLQEVENLLKNGAKEDCQGMRAIGYNQVLKYFKGEYDFETMKEKIKQLSRNYAKRQITFLKGMENIKYVDVSDREKAKNEIEREIKKWI